MIKRGVGWGFLTKAERAARVHNKAERAARFYFIILISNSALAKPSAQRESENTLGVAPFSPTGRPLFQLAAPPLILDQL